MNLSKAILLPIGALGLAFSLVACGSSDSGTSADAPAVSSSQSPAPTASGSSNTQDREAFRACLEKQGITLPSRAPDAARPTAAPSGRPQDGQGFPGGPQLPDGVDQQAFQDAMQACGGNFSGLRGGGLGGTAFEAYRSCLADHGVTLPSSAPRAPLDTSDAKVAAAQQTCAPLLPTRAPQTRN